MPSVVVFQNISDKELGALIAYLKIGQSTDDEITAIWMYLQSVPAVDQAGK